MEDEIREFSEGERTSVRTGKEKIGDSRRGLEVVNEGERDGGEPN